jgi:hypothetical protein
VKRALPVRLLLRWVLLGASAAVSACALQGPRLMPVSHLAYNEAVQISVQRELLLNLVRLRHTETPEFLAISSISSQMQFDAAASLSGSFGDDGQGRVRLAAPGAAAAYSESPTVTFSPLRDEEFTRRLVAPVELDSLYLLTRYGWSLERTLRLLAEEVNGIRNAVPREAMTAQDAESLEHFAELARVMQSLHERRLVEIDVVERWTPLSSPIPSAQVSVQDLLSASADGHRFEYAADSTSYSLQTRTQHYVLSIAAEASATPEHAEMLARLGLQPGRSTYEIDAPESPGVPPGSALTIRARSVLGAMAYAAQGIEIAEYELERGPVAPRALLSPPYAPLLQVRSSETEPVDAFVAVPYRGRWFYVDDDDLDSKRTLGALISLIRLEIGAGGAQNVPVLTLPVGR